jgi:hypothetical protein
MRTRLGVLIAGFVFLLAAPGCREEGPAERAGQRIDEAVEKLRHGDEGAAEEAGRRIDEAVEEMREAVEDASESAKKSRERD